MESKKGQMTDRERVVKEIACGSTLHSAYFQKGRTMVQRQSRDGSVHSLVEGKAETGEKKNIQYIVADGVNKVKTTAGADTPLKRGGYLSLLG